MTVTATKTKTRDAIRSRLVEMWGQILDHTDFDPSDSFFDVGGHSLIANDLAIAIESEFGISMPTEAIFDHPSIDDLTAYIASKS